MPENLISRDGFSRPVPRQPAHLHTQAESGAYLRDSSRVPRRRPIMKLPYAIGSVPSLSGHANAYRWRSLPRFRRHRASKPQGSPERVLPWQVTMDQVICASLSYTNYSVSPSIIHQVAVDNGVSVKSALASIIADKGAAGADLPTPEDVGRYHIVCQNQTYLPHWLVPKMVYHFKCKAKINK